MTLEVNNIARETLLSLSRPTRRVFVELLIRFRCRIGFKEVVVVQTDPQPLAFHW